MIANLTRLTDEVPYKLTVTPPGFRDEGVFAESAIIYRNKAQGLLVLASIATLEGGKKVLHISLSRRSRLPSWDDVKRVKEAFLGSEREAYHVLPKQSDYVNLHPYCLHLWSEDLEV